MKKLNLLIMAAFAGSAMNVMAADSEVKPKSATEQRATIEKAMTPETRTGTTPSANTPKPVSATEQRSEAMRNSNQPTTSDTKVKSSGNTDVGVVKPKSETDDRRDMSTGKTTTYGGTPTGASMGTSSGASMGTSSSSGPSGMSMTGGMMGSHAMNGKITKINHKTGKVTVKTDEGNMDVHFPASDIQDLKRGDTISVHMGYTRG